MKELEIDGRRAFSEWFRKLKDKAAKATILGRLARLAEAGSVGDYRYLGDAVFELRVHQGPGYRIYIYFGVEQEQVILLLLGGDKSSQSRDIAKATKLWKRYQEERTQMPKTRKRTARAVRIDPTVIESLADPEVATAYIQDCLQERGPARSRLLLRALMDVARTQGISALVKGSPSRRRLLYKVLSEEGNPRLATLESILNAMGLAIDVRPLKKVG